MTRTPLLISLALATAAAVAPAKPAPAAPAAQATVAKPAAVPAAQDRTPRYDWGRLGRFDYRTGKYVVAPDRVPLPGEGC